MKPILLAALLAAVVAGFVSAAAVVVLVGRGRATAAQEVAVAERDLAAAAAAQAQERLDQATGDAALSSDLAEQVAILSGEVDSLRRELASLRESQDRQAVPSAVESAPINVDQLAAVQRDAVVQILQEERDREAAKRDEERKLREQQALAERASRLAKELGLGAADEGKLTDFMGVAATKRDELFRGMRDGNFDREAMRTNVETYRSWAETELTATFGANLGAQIMQANRDVGFGGGDRGGPPWQGQGGQSGNQGGSGRPGGGGQ